MSNKVRQEKMLNKFRKVVSIPGEGILHPAFRLNAIPYKSMKCDAEIITRIQAAMKRKCLNQSQLAKAVGYHRSTISLLLKGKTPNIDDDLIDLLNDALGADVAPSGKRHEQPSPLALDLSRLAKEDAKIAHLLEAVIDVVSPEIKAFLPHVDTKRLPKIGAEVTKIVMRWEEGVDPHYSKIAVEVLDFLRDFYTKEAKAEAKSSTATCP